MKDGLSRWRVVKNLLAKAGDTRDVGSILRSGRSLGVGNDNRLQYSCLENSMDGGAWRGIVQEFANSWIQLSSSSTVKDESIEVGAFAIQKQWREGGHTSWEDLHTQRAWGRKGYRSWEDWTRLSWLEKGKQGRRARSKFGELGRG